MNPAFPHRAWYDENGNIVLPLSQETDDETPQKNRPLRPITEEIVEWIIVDDAPPDLHQPEPNFESPDVPEKVEENTPARVLLGTHVREQIVELRTFTRQTVREGVRQYRVSIVGSRPLLERAVEDFRKFFRAIWNFLAQPVWVPTRKKEIKQYSRGALFLFDIIRFGGTFTAIFLMLFVALNYDSFWQITKSNVETILHSPSIESPVSPVDNALIETLKAQETLSPDGRNKGELFSYLPTVGPPDNRMIIPKLNLNVPLVQPPTAALLNQDWTQVETDIQEALQKGVVHYPGTARPGQAGNFFVTGHSSYYPWSPGKYKTVFARLDELNIGDEYWVYYKGDRHRYIVQSKKEVLPSDTTVLDQPENKRISTLMTCTPVGTTLRRLIVVAREVDPITGQTLKVGERTDKGVTPKLQLEALPI